MNGDPVEDALRSRPSDERLYDEPLGRLPGSEPAEAAPLSPLLPSLGVGRGHPTIRTRPPIGWLTALILLALIGTMLAISLGFRSPTAQAPTPQSATPHPSLMGFEPTGVVGCFGDPANGRGWQRGSDSLFADCPVLAVAPPGYVAATWKLDPAYSFSASSQEIQVLVMEQACDSGRLATGRVAQSVRYEDARVLVELAVRLPAASADTVVTCPANPWTPYLVQLSEPVGRRDLFDASPDPMTLIARPGQRHSVAPPSR
jgi:hypothetical protein